MICHRNQFQELRRKRKKMMVQVFRGVHFFIQFTCLLFVIGFNWKFPNPKAIQLRDGAKQKGWTQTTLFFTFTIQHFTIISEIFLSINLLLLLLSFDMDYPEFIAQFSALVHGMQTSVGVLYYLLLSHDPFHLFPKELFPKNNPEQIVKRLTSFVPPSRMCCCCCCSNKKKASSSTQVIWIILHIQHTLAPAHMWCDVYLQYYYSYYYGAAGWGETSLKISTLSTELWILLITILIYGLWNLFCWFVSSEPAYPIQRNVYRNGGWFHTIGFYVTCVSLMLFSCYLSRQFREYLFNDVTI